VVQKPFPYNPLYGSNINFLHLFQTGFAYLYHQTSRALSIPTNNENTFYETPVCILGAGPAGLTASLYLSKFGIEHVVVDKQTFPRDKVCGECFDGRVGRILEDLDATYPAQMTKQNITSETRRYTLHINGEELPVQFPDHHRPKLLSKRLDFDRFLYQKAEASPHATIITGVNVDQIDEGENAIVLRGRNLTVEAQLTIIATGAKARADKADSDQTAAMIYGRRYYRQVIPRHDATEVEMYYFKRPLRGCLVICPLPDGSFNVEIGCTRKAYKACGLSLEQIMLTYLEQLPDLRNRFAAAVPLDKIKGTYLPLPRRLGQCAGNRRLRAGAEAYSFNPLTGAGVGNAMVMGQLAARTAQQCVAADDYSYQITRGYEKAVRRRLKTMIRFNYGVNLLLRYVYLVEWMLPVLMRRNFLKRLLGRADFVKRIFQWRMG
jgi:flavin-dependent dehydrogenase